MYLNHMKDMIEQSKPEFIPTLESVLDMLFDLITTSKDECSKEELEDIKDVRETLGSLVVEHRIRLKANPR